MTEILGQMSLLVFAATGMQALGLLFQKQIILRLLVLTGSGLYILYYVSQTPHPLWDAAIGSSLIAFANIVGLAMLLHRRMTFRMNEREREVFDAIGTLEPGIFRLLMRHGTLHETNLPIRLTTEGERPPYLYYVFSGDIRVTKGITEFQIRERLFVGEIAWLTKAPATASASLLQGGVYVAWDIKRLERLCARRPHLRQALDALICRDLAGKVATGVQPERLRIVADPSFNAVGRLATGS